MKNLLIDAGRDSTQIFEEILDDIMFTSESFTVILENNSIVVTINDEENTPLYVDYIADKITNYVLNFIEPKMIRDEVELECLELLDEQIENDIIERVEWELLHKNEIVRQNYFLYLKEDIYEGLTNRGLFNLFGFLNFKTSMRRLEIKDYVNMVLEDYFIDENEEQFFNLIRKVVSIQQPQTELLNLIILGPNKYELITGNNTKIDMSEVEEIIDDLMLDKNQEVEQFHLILSVLMTIIPLKIDIHTNEKQDPYIQQALKRIYGNRVTICHYCELCEFVRYNEEDEK